MNVPIPSVIETPTQSATWISKADLLISLVIVLLAGFCAAYISRNHDQWLHFASGRDLLNGTYPIGTDPYSYLAADRYWVNHSWLHDLSVYGLYSLDESGQVVVAFKALLFALAISVAMLIRPRGAAVWPWWLLAALAVVAAAPYTHLRPTIGSGLFIITTLFILLRLPWKPGSLRNPLILAALCGFWANLDQWFLLGPVIVLLVLLAEVIQKHFMRENTPGVPLIRDLSKAFVFCMVATLFNPHLFRVWTLPVELGFGMPEAIRNDPQLNMLQVSPLSRAYRDSSLLGRSINGGAFYALFIIGSGLLALGLARVRLACLVLWILFAFLALLNFRLILFFAIAAIPLAATPLSDLASRFNVGSQSRGLLLASSLARLFAVPLSLLLLLCAWPGWLHPIPGDRAFANRVTLGVEPDPGLARAARHLGSVRKQGRHDGLHGCPLSLELANHMAWFAPGERVAVNSRLRHHVPELDAWLAARRAVVGDKPGDLPEAIRALKADYAMMNSAGVGAEVNLAKVYPQITDHRLSIWHLDGRVAVLGRSDKPIRFDATLLAYAHNQEPLPEPVVRPAPPRAREAMDDFVLVDKPLPLATLDASVYRTYAEVIWQESAFGQKLAHLALGFPTAVISQPSITVPDQALASNLLAQRAARQAMAANPDHPLAYVILAECLENNAKWMPIVHTNDFELQRITARRRFLDRMPPVAELPVSEQSRVVGESLDSLLMFYQQRQMEDCFVETQLRSFDVLKRLLPLRLQNQEQFKAAVEQIDKQRALLVERSQQMQSDGQSQTVALARVRQAYERRRPEEMLRILQSEPFKNDSSSEAIEAELAGIDLCLEAGMLESVLQYLEPLRSKIMQTGQESGHYRQVLSKAKRIAGNFHEIHEVMETAKASIRPLTGAQKEFVLASIRSPEAFALRTSGTLDGALGGIPAIVACQLAAQPALQVWREQSNSDLRLGMLAILEGNPDEARKRFEAALVPQNIPLPDGDHAREVAERFLNLVRNASQSTN